MAEDLQKNRQPNNKVNSPIQQDKEATCLKQQACDINQRILELVKLEVSAGNPEDKYIQLEKIGEGVTGNVFRGETIDDGRQVAIKVMEMYSLREPGKIFRRVLDELTNLKHYQHPCIPQYLDSYIVDDSLWLVMEYIDGITLADFLIYHGESMQMGQTALVCKTVLTALEYLHQNGVIHRDIKNSNIVLGVDGTVKLIDMGYSITEDRKPFRRAGTPHWIAPEVIERTPYDRSVDIWSLGITVISMLTGYTPYTTEMGETLFQLILQNGTPAIVEEDCFEPEVQDFLKQCLQVDPKKRASASSLLKHKFLDKVEPACELSLAGIRRVQRHAASM